MNRIICERRIWTENKLLHSHDFGHLIFPLKGGALNIQTKAISVTINNNDLFYLPSECEHVFFSQQNWSECLVVDIPVFIVSKLINSTIKSEKCFALDTNWQALRTLLLTESYRKEPLVNHLVYYSVNLLREQKEESPSIRFIHEHYFENISVKTLAKLENYNAAYYGQWFKNKMGVTPQQYIQKLRLDEAKRLIQETNFSVLDITQQVGYKYQSYLTYLFKRNEDMTPQQFKICNKHKKI